jgi:uncharacterized membrane protein
MLEGPMAIVLGLVGFLILLAGPVSLIFALESRRDLKRLRRQVMELERKLAEGSAVPARRTEEASTLAASAEAAASPGPLAPRAPAGVSTAAPRAPATPGRATPSAPAATTPRARPIDLETILGGQWLTWIGIVAIFVGTAFFLAYDIGDHPLAGAGQVVVGLLVGALFLTAGRTFGIRLGIFLARGLLGGGIALLFLSAYASHAFHGLVSAVVVYPFLFGAALVGATLALRENSLMIAALTLLCALLTPVFLTGRREAHGALFVYLTLVSFGSTIVSRRRGWPALPLLGFWGTVLLVAWWWARDYSLDLRGTALLGTGVLWLLYAGTPLTQSSPPGFPGAARALVLVANALLFELVLFEALAPDLEAVRGIAAGLLALTYVAAARITEDRRGDSPPVALTRTSGLLLAALAVPVQFDLEWVTLGWALLALVLLHAGALRGSGRNERLIGYAVLLLAALRTLVWDTIAALSDLDRYRPIVNGNFLVGVATAGALGLSARMVARARPRLTSIEKRLAAPLVLTASTVLWVRISVETVAGFLVRERLTGQDLDLPMLLTMSLVWAVYAALLILAGFVFRYRPVRYLGIVVLALLFAKVFLLDISALERGYRIASFVGVGLLVLLTSILYQRQRGGS